MRSQPVYIKKNENKKMIRYMEHIELSCYTFDIIDSKEVLQHQRH